MDCRVWNIMHDGTITSIEGIIPGDVRITVALEYLRQEFEPRGSFFALILTRCVCFTYTADIEDEQVSILTEIARYRLELLTAVECDKSDCIEVIVEGGVLRMLYADEKILLDSGLEIAYEDLQMAAKRSMHRYNID